MHDAILGSGRDTFLVAIPFLGMLVVCFFRLDERFAAPKKTGRQPRPPCGVDLDGRSILCDPDGRPWNNPRLRRSVWNATALGEWNGVRGAEDCEHGFQ
jgi:hypothetical protein